VSGIDTGRRPHEQKGLMDPDSRITFKLFWLKIECLMPTAESEVRTTENEHQQSATSKNASAASDRTEAIPAPAGDRAAKDPTPESSEEASNVGTLKRDYIIFLGAMTILCGGVADGLIRGVGVSPWLAVPAGVVTWGVIFWSIYRKYQAL